MRKQGLCLVLLAGLLLGPPVWGQSASDITVPSGFRVEKILEANRIPDPQNIAFLPNGDMLVGSMFWRIARLTPTGDVSTYVKFKTLEGPNPFDLVVTPSGTIFFTHSSDQVTNPGLYRLDGGNPVLVTPPGWMLTYLAMDEAGTFYATASKAGIPACVVKITDPDGDGQYDVTPFLTLPGRNGLFYRAGYLYVSHGRRTRRKGHDPPVQRGDRRLGTANISPEACFPQGPGHGQRGIFLHLGVCRRPDGRTRPQLLLQRSQNSPRKHQGNRRYRYPQRRICLRRPRRHALYIRILPGRRFQSCRWSQERRQPGLRVRLNFRHRL